MTLKRKIIAIGFLLLTVSWILFIFLNSAEPASVSKEKSSELVELIIEKFFHKDSEKIQQDFIVTINRLVRKVAHFIEFAVLSFLLFVTLFLFRIRKRVIYPLCLSSTFLAACVDEIIQYFTPGRACRFSDVLIDISGGITALVFVFLFNFIAMKMYRRSYDV